MNGATTLISAGATPAATQTSDLGAHGVCLLARLLPVPLVRHGDPAEAGAERRGPRRGRCVRVEPPLVELLGDEAADVRVEAERPVEEDTAVRRDRRVVTHQVAEHRRLAPVGMRALEHLVELLRVADEHRRPGGGRHRARIRQRDLAGLVDEEEVEALLVAAVREQPGRPADDVAVDAVRVVEDVLDDLPRELRLGVPAARLLHALELQPTLGRGALDLGEELVDRPVARRGDADTLPFRDEPRDQPSGRPGLPGAGRALDHEMPWDGAARRGERASPRPIASSSSASSSRSVVWTSRPKASRRRIDSSTGYAPPPSSSERPNRSSASSCAFVE